MTRGLDVELAKRRVDRERRDRVRVAKEVEPRRGIGNELVDGALPDHEVAGPIAILDERIGCLVQASGALTRRNSDLGETAINTLDQRVAVIGMGLRGVLGRETGEPLERSRASF